MAHIVLNVLKIIQRHILKTMSNTFPQIRINFSWLLHDCVSRDKYKLHSKDWGGIPTQEQCYEWTENYRKEWAKYEDAIVPALTNLLGVQFRQPVIDVALAPGIRAMSDPLILNFMHYPDQFVDSLTHELIHILLTDNNKYSLKDSKQKVRLDEAWAKLFGKHEFDALVHIPVHAVHKCIYLDVVKEPERLGRDKQSVKGDKQYTDAWDYVEAHDYRKIVVQLKDFYQQQ